MLTIYEKILCALLSALLEAGGCTLPESSLQQLPSSTLVCLKEKLHLGWEKAVWKTADRLPGIYRAAGAVNLQEIQNRADQEKQAAALQKELELRFFRTPEILSDSGKADPQALVQKKRFEMRASSAEASPVGERSESQGGVFEEKGFHTACPVDGILSLEDESVGFLDFSESFVLPVSGPVSAGTWAYPGGGLHLGLDTAVPIGTPVRAPANGLVLYASGSQPSAGGFPGCWNGWPAGAGNSLLLLCETGQGVFAFSFFHLSSPLYVQPGSAVKQNDILALSGNSGNSTGPHVHLEVIDLTLSFEEAVQYFQKTADFSFGCGWNNPQMISQYGRRVRPELFFGLIG